MSMTLGEALTADDSSELDLRDKAEIREGYEKARRELENRPEKIAAGSQSSVNFDQALEQAVLKALDIALDDILGRAWSGWSELRDYADPNLEGRNYLTLSDHTIDSAYEPSVDVMVGGQKLHSFDFAVTAALKVHGGELEIEHGKIQAIRLGKLKLGGAITLGDQTLLEKSLTEVTLPGVMRLAHPIAIR